MTQPFDYFVIFAEMRTGSNLLEQNLGAVPGILCHGEVYNPTFIGRKNREELLGVTLAMREADPLGLLDRIIAAGVGLPGFRFFHDHDPRVLARCLEDRRCAKVVLTRNPLESYISLRIASQTGQWRLADVKTQKTALARFEAEGFERHLEARQAFQMQIQHALQVSGQTAFYIDYEDLADLAVLNGLAAFLGVEGRAAALPDKLKKQNPEALVEKVENPEEMEAALARLDRFNLSRTPNFEPRRGAGVPGLVAAEGAGLLYMPIRPGPDARVRGWMEAAGGGLRRGFNQKSLRAWRQETGLHRSFTVLRHPLPRAHAAFCQHVVLGRFAGVRRVLRRLYKVRLPQEMEPGAYDLAAHRAGFLAFLKFAKASLNGQASLRVDAVWASQAAVLEAYGRLAGPDLVLREERLQEGLDFLAAEVGCSAPKIAPAEAEAPFALADVVDDEIEAACREAYQRDYATFGFGRWRG